MTAQVNFCLFLNAFPENWHICVNKGFTYLQVALTTVAKVVLSQVFEEEEGAIKLKARKLFDWLTRFRKDFDLGRRLAHTTARATWRHATKRPGP